MFRPYIGCLVLLAGCAEISGLGSLDVCDGACVDATADVGNVQDSGAQDSALDTTSPPDASADAPVIISDVTIDAPPASLVCVKPSDCNQNNPFCCGNIQTQGQYPQCKITSVSSKCQGNCSTNFAFQQCKTDTARLCATNQDCTEALYNHCCTFLYNNTSVELCTNPAIAEAGGATSCQ